MTRQNQVIAFIPARGGSKGIINKNIKELCGKPLIEWTIEQAKNSEYINRIIVSTDDSKIAEISEKLGAEVIMRPPELAGDQSLVIDAIKYTIRTLKKKSMSADFMVVLQPTSPLRTIDSINKCVQRLIDKELDSVATFTEAELNPHRAWKITDNHPEIFITGAEPWLPRQQLPEAYQLNGAVYAFRMDEILDHDGISLLFGNSGAVLMSFEDSIDIDNDIHWKLAELMLRQRSR